MSEPFFTQVEGHIPFGGLDSDRSTQLQGVRPRPARARQAHGGAPPDRRLRLALVRVAGNGHVRCGHAGPALAGARSGSDGRRAGEDGRRVRVPGQARRPVLLLPRLDVAPTGRTFAESRANLDALVDDAAGYQERTGVQLLWGTANLFTHPRYAGGASTNPDPEVFAYAAAQVRQMLEVTQRLGGTNYVLWGGREGYDTLLNTDLRREGEQLARFLHLVAEHKHKIGFQGTLLIEPKPMEPTKHQYDHDTATVHGFLVRNGLEGEYKVNIEANHATLAGYSFHHEVAYAVAHGILGSIDANRGDPQNGWDTDQFPNSVEDLAMPLYEILKGGGLGTGGFNFDAKLRRQSIDRNDLFHAHIGGIDTLARALLVAADMHRGGHAGIHGRGALRRLVRSAGTVDPRGRGLARRPGGPGRGRRRSTRPCQRPAGAVRERGQPAPLARELTDAWDRVPESERRR